jgi:DNA polymerase-3 subunit delta'
MNWEMIGHEWAAGLLQKHIGGGQVRHAYLFTGPQGVGRRTLALRLAQALNCPQPPSPGDACRVCRVCTQIERMAHPDLAIVQSAEPGGVLKVDQVRELQRSLALHPYEARYRVALLLRFEEANPSAMNALLKTLEEPSPQVVIVLTAESAESLFPTIVSRCEVLRLRPLAVEQVEVGLQNRWGVEPERARLLAHISAGRPGYAIRLHQEPGRLEQRQRRLDDHMRLLSASRVERFAYAETLVKERDTFRLTLLTWLALWRDVLLRAAGSAAPLANPDRQEQIELLAGHVGLTAARRVVAALERTLRLVERNINPRLAAEVLMLDLPHPDRS